MFVAVVPMCTGYLHDHWGHQTPGAEVQQSFCRSQLCFALYFRWRCVRKTHANTLTHPLPLGTLQIRPSLLSRLSVGVFAPTLFSKTFGNLVCESCTSIPSNTSVPFACKDCHYDMVSFCGTSQGSQPVASCRPNLA